MRMLGCLEMGSGWCFRAKHIAGVDNTIADGISRWADRSRITSDLRRSHPNVAWHEQVLTDEALRLITSVLDSSTSGDQLRVRLEGLMSLPSVLGAFFAAS